MEQIDELVESVQQYSTAKELAEFLKKTGLNIQYLTLEGKKLELEELRRAELYESNREDDRPFWEKPFYSGEEAKKLKELEKSQSNRELKHAYMVRATDVFGVGNIQTVPKDGQVLSHDDPRTGSGYNPANLRSVGIPEKYTFKDVRGKEKEIKEAEETFLPYLRQYRSTKHFTLNTLVSANNGGSWDNMPYIYIEPL